MFRSYANIVLMTTDELRSFLRETGMSQAQLARLLDVTPRAVTLWLAGDRTVPGPAEAYIRLFRAMPTSVRLVEMQRLKVTKAAMRDGVYACLLYTSRCV